MDLPKLERVLIVTGGIVGGLAFGVSSSFGLFLKPICDDLGFGRQVIGLAAGINFWLNGATSIGWSAVTDKHGVVPVLLTGAALECASLYATSRARREAVLYEISRREIALSRAAFRDRRRRS